jgi:RpiR family transcriptional regulator, carbohydrate utilization regulator
MAADNESATIIGHGPRGRPITSTRTTARLGVLSRLRAARRSAFKAGQQVIDYILANPQTVIRASVTEVGEASGVSEASVVRLCQYVGYRGFQDLKVSLAHDMVESAKFIHEDVKPGDPVATVTRKVIESDTSALTETLKVLDMKDMERAVQLILQAERIEFYGIGSTGPIAVDAYYRMLRIGINAVVCIDSHMQSVSAAMTGPGVVVVSVSHSGSTRETVHATRLAKQAGAHTICITNYAKSPITAYADVVLYTAAAETMFRTEAMTSRIAELSIVDALYVCVALARFEESLSNIEKTAVALATKRF